jgi:hypothetical protein
MGLNNAGFGNSSREVRTNQVRLSEFPREGKDVGNLSSRRLPCSSLYMCTKNGLVLAGLFLAIHYAISHPSQIGKAFRSGHQ